MTKTPYPSHWPRPSKRSRPDAVVNRITEEQKLALYNRTITTRDLARLLNVSEMYLSTLFPGKNDEITKKAVLKEKRELIDTRNLYRLELAKDILKGKYSVHEAACLAHVSYNTMLRTLAKAKKKFPELVEAYENTLVNQRQTAIEKARNARRVHNAS